MDFESMAQIEINKNGIAYEVSKRDSLVSNLRNPDDFVITYNKELDFSFPWLRFARDWHSDEDYQEIVNENKLLKFRIKEIIKNNTHHCDFGCDNDCERDGSLDYSDVQEIERLLGE